MRKLLLSIKPIYVRRILDGSKKVEYRKRVHADKNVQTVLIYESAPTMRVVGEFKIAGIIEGTPEEIWAMTHNIGGIDECDYFKYFSGCEKAYAYQISELQRYTVFKKLCDFDVLRAPQCFQYIEIVYEEL